MSEFTYWLALRFFFTRGAPVYYNIGTFKDEENGKSLVVYQTVFGPPRPPKLLFFGLEKDYTFLLLTLPIYRISRGPEKYHTIISIQPTITKY